MECLILSLDGLVRAKKPPAASETSRSSLSSKDFLICGRDPKCSQTKYKFHAHNSRGLRETYWEATGSSRVKPPSGFRRRRASSAERRTRSGLLFSCETWAR